MKCTRQYLGLLVLLIGGLQGERARAEEPARRFLDGLRARGYHDTALEYLDWIATSDLAPPELQQTLKLEKGLTLIAASRGQRDRKLQAKQLDDAQQLLDQFIQENSEHSRVNSARSQLGHLVSERARIEVRLAQQENRIHHLKQARRQYEQAHQVYTELQQSVRGQLEAIPKVLDVTDRKQAALAERRTRLRADYLDTLIRASAIREEMADTHERGTQPYDELLIEAAASYEEIYKSYRTRIGGLFARMYQGRAHQKLGKYREALGFFVELLDQPDSPAPFRRLKTETLQLAMECWLHKSQTKYVEAIRRGSEWVGKARADEDRHPDWLELRLMLARAYLLQADDLKKADSPNKRTINQSLNEARRLADVVARYEGEHQRAAREMIALLGGPDRTNERPDPTNFVQARKAGTDALEVVETGRAAIKELADRLATEMDAQKRAELQKRLHELEQTLAASLTDATLFLRLAITLADPETAVADVNLVRYFLCYLYYLQQDYYRSAVLGEFVARRYPDSAGARPCAKIAMACYLLLHARSNAEASEAEASATETDHIISIAEYIVGNWPEHAEAQDALSTLIPFVLNAGELGKARGFLGKIPADSPRRGDAERKTGKAMWQAYLRGVRALQSGEEQLSMEASNARAKELDELKTSAPKVLAAAYRRLQPGDSIDYELLTSLLALAQAYVENQQAEQAVTVLENEHFGPLTLVRKRHSAAQSADFSEECYRTALQAHIGSLSTTQKPDATIQAATQVMQEMRATIGETAQSRKRLISVYVGLAQDLEAQLKVATPAAKQALSKGFETFLSQLGKASDDFQVLNWVAETFASLGAGFDTEAQLTSQASGYYEQSAIAFQNILQRVELDSQMRIQMEMRLAVIQRKQRRFGESLARLSDILREKSVALNVQVEAAMTLQASADRSDQDSQAALYDRAIKGAQPDERTKKNLIWGWGKIARETAPYPKFKEVFHQARYNLALCRFLQAQANQGEERTRLLAMAKKDISLTKRLYGLGGNRWLNQYDALMKRIQQSMGDPAIGVRALDTPTKGGDK